MFISAKLSQSGGRLAAFQLAVKVGFIGPSEGSLF